MLTTLQTSFGSGELSPSLFGRTDLQKVHQGASTMRNLFANYRGGASSRAGTAYVGMCKQGAPNIGGASTSNPPRDIKFQFNINQGYALEFGDQYMRIKSNGAYVTEATKTISNITNGNPAVITSTAHGYSNGDWIYITGVVGMTNLNGLVWIVTNAATNTYQLTDLFGNIVNSFPWSAYTSGGTSARIYTVVSPYAAIDLPYLKFTQSADTMSLTCVNQVTNTEYPPYNLERFGATNWTFTQLSFASSLSPPNNVNSTVNASSSLTTWYSYVVTAVSSDGEESIASGNTSCENNDISIYAGTNTITWSSAVGATSYNVYASTPSYGSGVPAGVLYGFIGTSLGTTFTDTNITPDFTTVPPQHNNPFARGQISFVTPAAGGSGYSQATVGYSIATSTGSGAIIAPIVVSGAVVAYVVESSGIGYAAGDTITITGGTGATATLVIGAETGTYPSTVAYYQQRCAYANTLNNPDTYYMSQPGAYLNMDSSIPVSDADAIVGAPWAQQVNGVQAMVPMPNGLVILTGSGAWLLNGGSSAALTPADQDANAQAYNGCSPIVPPLVVNYDILYVQAKGSIVRDLSYNFFTNVYTGTDTTVLSNHLFNNHLLLQWAYAEEPYKLVWAVREDGVLLSFTYLKEQDIYAWARHDTNGLFKSICSVTEPPVDAVYVIVQRYINGAWVYFSERMDNRSWQNVEQCWCVDAGLTLPLSYPSATLMPASANGTSNISSVDLIYGGTRYTSPVVSAVDSTGAGTGATFSATVVNGVITAISPINQGNYYTPGTTSIVITDSTGSGAIASPIITNNVVFTASSSVFTSGMVGDVIRVGGGKATITSYSSGTQVTANITQPITATIPNDPNNMPIPATSGNWSIGTPTTTITGLNHLNGMTVSILADGSVSPQQTVVNGSITLPSTASQVTIGLPFVAQLQTMYLDPQGQQGSDQGKRKTIMGVTVRMEASRGISIGTNQPDSSTQPNGASVPWSGLYAAKERNASIGAGSAVPLFTGDEYLQVGADWETNGQVAIQTANPLPLNILSLVVWYTSGDSNG